MWLPFSGQQPTVLLSRWVGGVESRPVLGLRQWPEEGGRHRMTSVIILCHSFSRKSLTTSTRTPCLVLGSRRGQWWARAPLPLWGWGERNVLARKLIHDVVCDSD